MVDSNQTEKEETILFETDGLRYNVPSDVYFQLIADAAFLKNYTEEQIQEMINPYLEEEETPEL